MVFLNWQVSKYRAAWHKEGIQWLVCTWFGLASAIVTGGLWVNRDWTIPGYDLKMCPTFYVVNAKESIRISVCISPLC